MWSENFKNYIFKTFIIEEINNKNIDKKIETVLERLKGDFENPEKHSKLFEDSRNLSLSILSKKYNANPQKTLEKCYELGVKKNSDYGDGNILRFREKGLIVRISDKYARVQNLLKNKASVLDEKIEDALEDIINYSVYGIMLSDKTWY
jgi:hypothetical protein